MGRLIENSHRTSSLRKSLQTVKCSCRLKAMAPSETDPLLPQGSSAPEISGYGFSRPSKPRYQNQTQTQAQSEVVDETEYVQDKNAPTQTSPSFFSLRVPLVLFSLLIGLALIITFFAHEPSDTPWRGPANDTSNIEARVDKILDEAPLIGPPSGPYSVVRIYSDTGIRWT